MIPSVANFEVNLTRLSNGTLKYPVYSDSFTCASFVRLMFGIPENKDALSLSLSDCIERPIQCARFGDIVFSRNFAHVGISLGHPYVLHYTDKGLQHELYINSFAGGWAYGG